MPAKKCVICNQTIKPDEETIPFKNRTAHLVCFNVHMKAIGDKNKETKTDLNKKTKPKVTKSKAKPKIELKDPVSEADYQEKKSFYEYLRQILDDDISTKTYAVVSKMMGQYDYFTFTTMELTLRYIKDIKGREVKGDMVGLIPFYYDEAQEYFKEVKSVEEKNKDKNINQMYKETVIRIKPKQRVIKQLDFD